MAKLDWDKQYVDPSFESQLRAAGRLGIKKKRTVKTQRLKLNTLRRQMLQIIRSEKAIAFPKLYDHFRGKRVEGKKISIDFLLDQLRELERDNLITLSGLGTDAVAYAREDTTGIQKRKSRSKGSGQLTLTQASMKPRKAIEPCRVRTID